MFGASVYARIQWTEGLLQGQTVHVIVLVCRGEA